MHARGAAKNDLSLGLVDPRLTAVLRRLAARYPVVLVRFGDAGPLAGGTVPFRMAEIAVPTTRLGRRKVSELRGMEKLLKKQRAGDRAELKPTHMAHGKLVLESKWLESRLNNLKTHVTSTSYQDIGGSFIPGDFEQVVKSFSLPPGWERSIAD